jgi:hypothetical protein
MTRGREVVLGGLLTIVTAASVFSPRTRLACGCIWRRGRWAATRVAKHIPTRAEPRRGATYKGEART